MVPVKMAGVPPIMESNAAMGIIIPRPPMRRRESKWIESRLRRHAELMSDLERKGMARNAASSEAMRMLEQEETAREP